jgi:hypothetical protein
MNNSNKEERPICPCCGSTMDLTGFSFASKIVIGGIAYFNPSYCEYPNKKEG